MRWYGLAAVLLAVIVNQCQPCYHGTAGATVQVFAAGDSIFEGSEVELYSELVGGEFALFVRAVRGATGEKLTDSLVVADDADCTVLMVGTNDYTRAVRSGDWQRWEDSVRGAYAAASGVVVGVVPWYGQEWSRPILESLGVPLVDWDLAVNADPSLVVDTVGHPSQAGSEVLADMVSAAVNVHC